jgi:nitroimidazol reductase NimA-like FMN-containing flavoprotein (pyridoxamine 5'-phosphate oxidase superfamily)
MAKISSSLNLSSDEIDHLMRTESRLRIATIGPRNEINLTPMTFGWAGGNVYIFARGQKIANLRRNNTATVLVDVGSEWRVLKGIMMRGNARVLENVEDEATDQYLVEAQLNLGEKHNLTENGATIPYSATASGRSRRWIVFTPETVVSWNNERLESTR